MDWYEYIRLSINIISDKTIEQYFLQDIEKDGYVYEKIRIGVYSIPQDIIVTSNLLTKYLAPHG